MDLVVPKSTSYNQKIVGHSIRPNWQREDTLTEHC